MFVTLLVSQPFRLWLKDDASRNIWLIDVTEDTSQPLILWLKDDAARNVTRRFVTLDGSQSGTVARLVAPLNAPMSDVNPKSPHEVHAVSLAMLAFSVPSPNCVRVPVISIV